jgi:LDH2 family malate/lactate/ureidoglycolate dehydrogenase
MLHFALCRGARPYDHQIVVESTVLPPGTIRLPPDLVKGRLAEAFAAFDVPDDDAELVAEVLVAADLRGIRSHGVARIGYFLSRLDNKTINPRPQFRYRRGSPTTGTLLADDGLGIVAAARAMDEALVMAQEHGSGFVTVGRSSHFGYAGYWAERASRQGFVGISMSNSGGRVAPTFSTEAILGTNPLAVAIPGRRGETDFLLDMATSAVAVGKVETALREGRPVPPGWVTTTGAVPELDLNGVLPFDVPLLPLGGEGDDTGGHKGYGLGLMIELLCGALNGSALAERLEGSAGAAPAAMGHFMGAISLAGFGPPPETQAAMASTFDTIRQSRRQPGRDRIFIHGEPERISVQENQAAGLPITPALRVQLELWSRRLGLGWDWP